MKTSVLLLLLLHAPFALRAAGAAEGGVILSNSGGQPIMVCDETGIYRVPVSSTFQVALYYALDGTSVNISAIASERPAQFANERWSWRPGSEGCGSPRKGTERYGNLF
jgi:hypothetical protein